MTDQIARATLLLGAYCGQGAVATQLAADGGLPSAALPSSQVSLECETALAGSCASLPWEDLLDVLCLGLLN